MCDRAFTQTTVSVADEGLLPVENIVIAVQPGRRLDPLQVRTRARLGHRDGADEFAGGHLRQPFPLLLFGMQTYVQTARQKKTLDELLEYASTAEGLALVAANAEVKRRELKAQFEILTLQIEALDIQRQAAASQRDAAIATQRTAEYTKKNAIYMKWSVVVLAAASLCNLAVSIVALFIHR